MLFQVFKSEQLFECSGAKLLVFPLVVGVLGGIFPRISVLALVVPLAEEVPEVMEHLMVKFYQGPGLLGPDDARQVVFLEVPVA